MMFFLPKGIREEDSIMVDLKKFYRIAHIKLNRREIVSLSYLSTAINHLVCLVLQLSFHMSYEHAHF